MTTLIIMVSIAVGAIYFGVMVAYRKAYEARKRELRNVQDR